MFFKKTLTKEIFLHPQYFGPKIHETIKLKLYEAVEGNCSGRYGFIIAVTKVVKIHPGKVQEGTGFVIYLVEYEAVVFRPFKNEVFMGVVTEVNKMGILCAVGPLVEIFISKESGIDEDWQFDDAQEPCYISMEDQSRVQKDDHIRFRIMGVRLHVNGLSAIGTMKDHYLGKVSF